MRIVHCLLRSHDQARAWRSNSNVVCFRFLLRMIKRKLNLFPQNYFKKLQWQISYACTYFTRSEEGITL